MAGISSFGAYIPIYRLSREAIAKAWGGYGGAGEKAVANYDEDSITMAVEAARDCLKEMDRGQVDGLFYATTTSPYKEKQNSSLIATALDLRQDILTADFGNSLRAGTTALKAALDTVNSGSAKKMLVVVADSRLGAPQSEFEQLFGDGAAAFLVTSGPAAVSIEGSYGVSDEFFDVWRVDTDDFVNTWESRFVLSQGYNRIVKDAVSAALKKYNLQPTSFSKLVLSAPDARSHQGMAKSLGFDPKTQVQDPLLTSVGHTGAASVPMMLIAALEQAKAGDKFLVANHGDGADVLIVGVNEGVEKAGGKRGIKGHLASKLVLPTYEKYMLFRNLLERDSLRFPSGNLSVPSIWRKSDELLRFHGSKCKVCGTVEMPVQRICIVCQSKDQFDEVRLSDIPAKLFTFTKDMFTPSPDAPIVISIVNFEGGGRYSCFMTDRNPDAINVGIPIEMTFRKIRDAGHVHSYSWKTRPVR